MSAPCDLFSMDSGQILSPIKDFYCGKNVFLTGCTGVVGEVILEKLLRLKKMISSQNGTIQKKWQ